MRTTRSRLKIRPAHPVRLRGPRAPRPETGDSPDCGNSFRSPSVVDCAAYVDGRRMDVVPRNEVVTDAVAAVRRRARGTERHAQRDVGHPFVWIGLHEPDYRELEALAGILGLAPPAVESAARTHQRPKLERHDDLLVMVLKTVCYVEHDRLTATSQIVESGEITVFLGQDFVVTVRHGDHCALHPVRRRLEESPDLLSLGSAAVLHAVAGQVVDDYLAVTDAVQTDIDEVESSVLSPQHTRDVERIYQLKRELVELERAVTSLGQPLRSLTTYGHRVVHPGIREHIRDVGERLSRVRPRVASFDELLTSILQASLRQMTMPESPEQLGQLLERGDLPKAQQWLAQHPPHVIADELARMDAVTSVVPFRLLDKDRALAVFEELEPTDQQAILAGLRDQTFRDLVEAMDPDDRARMLGEAPAKVAKRVLAGLSPHERRMTAALLGYPEGSAGRVMTPETVALDQNLTVQQALHVVRAEGAQAETVYTLPVIDNGRRLVGVVELRELVVSPPDRTVVGLVDTQVPRVCATDPAEDAARLMRETNILDLPVVDNEDRLVGLLTIDDAVEVIEAADTEDVARQSGATPWPGHYMSASVWQLARSRALWLLLLIIAATLTVNVLQVFEATLEEVTTLALFIPLLVGTGGNAGAQAATAAVRALAVGEVRGSDLLAVVWRECRVGLALGTMLAAVGLVVGIMLVGGQIAVVVGLSLVAICAWAATVGATMPLLAKRLRIDPAVVSAPMVTTLVDATGLVIYFLTAHAILGL